MIKFFNEKISLPEWAYDRAHSLQYKQWAKKKITKKGLVRAFHKRERKGESINNKGKDWLKAQYFGGLTSTCISNFEWKRLRKGRVK